MIRWIKTGKKVSKEGTDIRYESPALPGVMIESRKRHIPHANGNSGTWDHTSYSLIRPDGSEKEYWSLKDAKAAAEGGKCND